MFDEVIPISDKQCRTIAHLYDVSYNNVYYYIFIVFLWFVTYQENIKKCHYILNSLCYLIAKVHIL